MQPVDENSSESAPEAQVRPYRKPWPAEVRDKAFSLFKRGYGYRKTAAKLGVPEATVQVWKRKWEAGKTNAVSPQKKKHLSPEVRAEARALFEQGYGFKRAAAKLDVPVETVRGWQKKWKQGTFQAMDPLPKLWSQEIRSEAISLFEEGHDYRRVAELLGVPVGTAHGWQQKWTAGDFCAAYSPAEHRYSEEIKEKAYSLRLAGFSLDEIHCELKVPPATIYRWFRKKDLTAV